jgi:hypothetical protein
LVTLDLFLRSRAGDTDHEALLKRSQSTGDIKPRQHKMQALPSPPPLPLPPPVVSQAPNDEDTSDSTWTDSKVGS